MSTRCSIKYERDEKGSGFHLFSDVLDDGDKAPVYLELHGVDFECDSSGRVLVTIPCEWAEKLGLIAARGKL